MLNRVFSFNQEIRPIRGWRERVAVIFLVIPLAVVSCAAVPESKNASFSEVVPPEQSLAPMAYYHFLRGYLAELAEDFPKALQHYRAGLQFDSDSVFLRFRMANLHFISGNLPKTIDLLGQIDPAMVRNPRILTQMAKMFAGAGKSDQSLSLFDQALARDPERSESYLEKGIFLFNEKQLGEAELMFARNIELAPQAPMGYFYLGKVNQAKNKNEEAELNYRKVIVRAPQFVRGYRELYKLLEANNQVAAATEVLEGYLTDVSPHHKKFRQELVRLLLRQKEFTRALTELEFMAGQYPEDLNVQIRRALVFAEIKDTPRAIEEMSKLVGKNPSKVRVRDYLGLLHEQANQYEEAIQAYQFNIDLDPAFYDSQIHLGYLFYRLKRYEEAEPHLRRSLKLHPGSSEPYLLLGLTQMQSQQHKMAMKTFEQGLASHPKNVDLRFNLGTVYDKLGRFSDVVREMKAILELNSEHADALNYLGYSYADRGMNINEAVTLTQRAVALKPDNGYYVDSLGWALFKMGRTQEALVEIKRAAGLVNNDPVIFEHMGEIYLLQNELDKAKQAWLRSIELNPKNGKLRDRFREEGFGDPLESMTDLPSKPRVMQYVD